MSSTLYQVKNTNGELISYDLNAYAVADTITQDPTKPDFESLRDIRSRVLLSNVLDPGASDVDKASLDVSVSEGDRIFIVDQNNVVHDYVAEGVQNNFNVGLIPVPDSNMNTTIGEFGGRTGSFNQNGTSSGSYKIFDRDPATNIHFNYNTDSEIWYHFENNTKMKLTSFYNKGSDTNKVKLLGSNDGVHWATIHDGVCPPGGAIYPIANPGTYSYVKIIIRPITSMGYGPYQHEFQVYSDQVGSIINTSAITQGTVPKAVYKYQPMIFFNDFPAIEKQVYTEYGTHGSSLYVSSIYQDMLINGRNIIPKVKFNAIGDELLELTAQIYDKQA